MLSNRQIHPVIYKFIHNHIASTGSNVGYAIWGIQVENVGCVTSPILTSGSSTSRIRDVFQWYGNLQEKTVLHFMISSINLLSSQFSVI